MKQTDIPIWERYTLTIEEASKYFRIGENKLRRLAEENKNANWLIMNGNRIQIKRKQFEKNYRYIGRNLASPKGLVYDKIVLSRIKALSIKERSKCHVRKKRRDNKGRILKTGESQRKDGRYLYKYIDSFGEPQFVYSWKLVATDRVPAGKRDCISLREKIAELQKDIHDGIDVVGKKMTLCQLYAKQNAQRPKVRKNTETGRKYLMDILKKDKLGVRSIDSIKPSDAKEWAIRMSENGYAYQTINNYKRSLKASFYIAIQDDCVRKNPFDFQLKAVLDDDTVPKTVLTEEQEEKLLAFAKADKTYSKNYDEILILLKQVFVFQSLVV